MTSFIQIHILTHYPASNPNRDDLGRPKTATIGGVQRQRISSQALKRALRTSPAFTEALQGQLGARTQRIGEAVAEHLKEEMSANPEQATKIARDIAAAFGKVKGEKDKAHLQTEQLAFISPDERAAALDLAEKALAGEKLPSDKDLAKLLLSPADGAVDIAMFGRMLANNPEFNRDAAVQIAHAMTTNQVSVEDDYYTAVDDLKKAEEDAGAGFVGEAGFGSGVYYVYANIDLRLLLENLAGDQALAGKAIEALVRALCSATPGGKRNSFAHFVRPEYVLVERVDGQPLNLFSAFAEPVKAAGLMVDSIERLREKRAKFGAAYGEWWTADKELDVNGSGSATLDDLAQFAAASLTAEAA